MSTYQTTSDATDAALHVEDVTKRFGGLTAVDEVSFTVPDGELLGIIGPNGAGKTTLFNVINGFLEPEEGRITVAGTDLTTGGPSAHAKHGMARTFQLVKPFDNLNVRENVMVGAFLNDGDRTVAREQAQETLEFLGLSDIAEQSPENITVAEKKKMELCRALATEPEILLVDEIVAGLQQDEMEDITEALEYINEERGTTIILIEHVMEAVMNVSERVIVLNEGKIIADGPPTDVADNEQVIEAYLGESWREQQRDRTDA